MKVHSEAFWKETQRPNTRLEKVKPSGTEITNNPLSFVRERELGRRVLAFGRGGRLWSVEERVVVGLP